MKEKKEKLSVKTIVKNVLAVIVLTGIICFGIYYANQYTENIYDLAPIEDGVYARYHTTHSRTPSNNYEVITLYFNNSVQTLNGDIEITYTNEKPYVYIKDINTVNADKIHVYIPANSVKYGESISIGK